MEIRDKIVQFRITNKDKEDIKKYIKKSKIKGFSDYLTCAHCVLKYHIDNGDIGTVLKLWKGL